MSAKDPLIIETKSCIDMLRECCEAHGNKIAVSQHSVRLTYKELIHQATCIAEELKRLGVGEGDLVGLYASRSPKMIAAIYGIILASAAYVPLDPAYPKSRTQTMSKDANLQVILTDLVDTEAFNIINLKIVNIDDIINDVDKIGEEYTGITVDPDSLAYVMFTSGSTGKPKGVMISHYNLSNFIRIVPKVLDINSNDVYLQSASITYALSVRQIFLALSYGAELVIANEDQIKDVIEYFFLIQRKGVTLVDFVPSHWRSIINALELLDSKARIGLLNNRIRRIVTVGEGLYWDIPQRWRKLTGSDTQIVNILGQTETTGLVSAYHLPEKFETKTGVVPTGKAIPETQTMILDPNTLKDVPHGGIGELCIQNPCVGKGYLGRAGLTAEKFHQINNPHSFIYRTGDLARIAADGHIEILGRSDFQVKIRGMRVELGEIESKLLSYNAVNEAAVIPLNKSSSDLILKGYVSLKSNSNFDENDLLTFLKEVLPSHMVPASISVHNELPHTPNGKIDRKQLQALASIKPQTGPSEDQLVNDTQLQLGKLWKQILGIGSVKYSDNFFDLGGSSLEAMILSVKIEETFRKRLPVSILYQAPTVEKFAQLLRSEGTDSWACVIPIRSEGSKRPLFMIHGAHGNVLLYKDIAKYINSDYPLYGVQAKGLDGQTEPHRTIEEMAEDYLKEMIAIQSHGPYFLLGYCMGGTIALEISQRLKALGRTVAFLGMIETYNWSSLPGRSRLDWTFFYIEKILFHWKNIFLLTGKERNLFVEQKIREIGHRAKIWKGDISNLLGIKTGGTSSRLSTLWDTNDRAAFSYRPQKYEGPVHHFTPLKRYKVHSVPEADWQDIAKEVIVHQIEAYPAAILMEPFVSDFAQQINKLLQFSAHSAHQESRPAD